MSSIILGITALVAINSFNYSVVKDIDRQAASTIGADLVVQRNRLPLSDEVKGLLDSIPGERASEMQLFSMSLLPEKNVSQFVQIRAIEGDFPFYGMIGTDPEDATNKFRTEPIAIVDDAMMFQFDLSVGDSIKLGYQTFEIGGRLTSGFGSNSLTASFAPTIYIDQAYLESTQLVQPGSLVNYSYFFKVPEDFDPDEWDEEHRQTLRNNSVGTQTVEEQKEDLTEAFEGLNYFLNLIALVSLLLGCIGVASSVFIYVKSKIPSIAVFRCLGMSGNQAFLIYFIQITVLGLLSVIAGVALGSSIQVLLPLVLSDFLPFDIALDISWTAIIEGFLVGLVITILFALLPLIAVRKISPLRTLRASFSDDLAGKDIWKWIIYVGIVLSIYGFLWQVTKDPLASLYFCIGLLVAFFLLYLVSKLVIWGVQRYFPRRWNYVLRQGLSNLFRPNNQTQTLLVSLGLGTAVLTTLFIIQGLLLQNVAGMDEGDQPNMILYGIEYDQMDGLLELTEEYNLPVIQRVPIVTMKIDEWKGKTKNEWLQDTTVRVRRWAANREARVTYRDTLSSEETLVQGSLAGPPAEHGDSIYISLDEGYAEGLNLEIGDEVIWNVQGTRITTYLGSLRDIEFRSLSTRFFIVFPPGVLENAPQFRVLVTKSPSPQLTGTYRSEVVKRYPNVSVIDLTTILRTVGQILDKISYVIQFMAIFCILTGLIVLISSLFLSKYQRIKESVLLRTLGASRSQIMKINATEYIILGALSAATGIILSIAGSYLLATYQMELDFKMNWWPIIIVFILVTGLTVLIGLLNSREVVNKSPLEVLRKEVG
ncbi:MAG: FtsX-like permease family protein [Bacteroidia bacterium]|nr:FtsX-like permease family protein [Bacteroidia bacterium]